MNNELTVKKENKLWTLFIKFLPMLFMQILVILHFLKLYLQKYGFVNTCKPQQCAIINAIPLSNAVPTSAQLYVIGSALISPSNWIFGFLNSSVNNFLISLFCNIVVKLTQIPPWKIKVHPKYRSGSQATIDVNLKLFIMLKMLWPISEFRIFPLFNSSK